ncbi:MAG: hypothetical protein H7Y61_09045 [Rhizobiales bacterium]|nr:hypothetical protein [Rhizobacter sp.]
MSKLLAAALLALNTGFAAAHSGHGFAGPHWHASELLGPAMLLGCAVGAFWMWRKKR